MRKLDWRLWALKAPAEMQVHNAITASASASPISVFVRKKKRRCSSGRKLEQGEAPFWQVFANMSLKGVNCSGNLLIMMWLREL